MWFDGAGPRLERGPPSGTDISREGGCGGEPLPLLRAAPCFCWGCRMPMKEPFSAPRDEPEGLSGIVGRAEEDLAAAPWKGPAPDGSTGRAEEDLMLAPFDMLADSGEPSG
mmetsp:Transcript_43561/g.128930  ORF Transcript_43561/g.128930 Transcript_43561/m.128930 type:complete len:111 (+) Transcript_43561:171-503(+)